MTAGTPPVESDTGPVTRALLALIGFYRVAVSPIRPPACRYEPSCSEYAVDALRSWGLARGSWLALRRLLRCHPLHAGGFDPVPPLPYTARSSAAGTDAVGIRAAG